MPSSLRIKHGEKVTFKALEDSRTIFVFVDKATVNEKTNWAPFGIRTLELDPNGADGLPRELTRTADHCVKGGEYEYFVYLVRHDDLADGNSRPKIIIKSDTEQMVVTIVAPTEEEPYPVGPEGTARVALMGRIERDGILMEEDGRYQWSVKDADTGVSMIDQSLTGQRESVTLSPGRYRITLGFVGVMQAADFETMDSVVIEVVKAAEAG